MRSVKILIAAGAASLLSGAAMAADIPMMQPPPPQYYAPPPQVDEFGGWYLRGDIGMTNTRGKLFAPAYNDPTTISYDQLGHEFTSGMSFGLGVGYQINNWFRMDVTGEYRSRSQFTGTDFASVNILGAAYDIGDSYRAGYTSWVGMVNAYVDLGTWNCITPFIGAGVGFAHNTFSGFSDVTTFPANASVAAGVPLTGLYQAQTGSKTDLAWAVHAGLAYRVSQNMTVELAYRYLDLGTGMTGGGATFTGGTSNRAFEFRDLTSHDLKLGVRWTCCDVPPPPPPLVTKG